MDINSSINILIVDDSPEALQNAGTILKTLGYPIRIALNGTTALELIQQERPTIILLDVSMDDMSGFQVCRQIKSNPKWADIAIIFVTASGQEQNIQEGFQAGAQDYVVKPFLASELLARVRTHIQIAAQSMELKNAYHELDQFCHSVSHDLKSPLLVIQQLTSLLVQSLPEVSSKEDFSMEDINTIASLLTEKCSYTLKLVESLLELSHISQITPVLEPLDLDELFLECFHELSILENQRNFRFSTDSLPPIMANSTLMKLLVQNILSNAIKFTRTKPLSVIRITHQVHSSRFILEIRDNGVGFDNSQSHKLFHIFSRLHSSEEFEGSGVGLTIVSRIMKSHNGTAAICSTPGEGTCVTLTFPSDCLI